MGYCTSLRGTITLSKRAYQRLMALDQLGWRFRLDTIADYLQNQLTYDADRQQITFDTRHKMYHHNAFFNILANYKDIETIDFCEQEGETYDCWHKHGWYILKQGKWAYLEDNAYQYDDKHPPLSLVRAWNNAEPLLVKAQFVGGIVDLVTVAGETYRAATAKLPVLQRIPAEVWNDFRPYNGGEYLTWTHLDPRYPFLSTEEILRTGSFIGPDPESLQ